LISVPVDQCLLEDCTKRSATGRPQLLEPKIPR
jgi:hypothetical protein